MKLDNLPLGAIDWTEIAPALMKGETGTVTQRVREFGPNRLRLVEYGAGYLADHWCHKGHVIHVLKGDLDIEYEDGTKTALSAGLTWHVGDDTGAPHRVRCARGSIVFIVD
jgi:hypothetical protein